VGDAHRRRRRCDLHLAGNARRETADRSQSCSGSARASARSAAATRRSKP
jgi:hypothetical protein